MKSRDSERGRRILFVCSQNKLRSPTAEMIFANHKGVEVDSAGLNHDAITPLSPEQIEWADTILVMERSHLHRLNRRYRRFLQGKRVAVLNIRDEYDYMDERLIALLKTRCLPYLPAH